MKPYLLVCATALALVSADQPKDSKAEAELERLQGTWKLIAFEADGTEAPLEQFIGMRLIITGDRFVVADSQTTTHGTLTVDPLQKPRTIDLTFTDGPEKGKTSQGIYSVDGEKAKLCLSLAGKDRPKEFKTKRGDDLALEVLERVKR